MTDSRTRLAQAFNAVLEESLGRTPESMFVSVPVGKLVDAALRVFDDVPRVPAFDPATTPLREFFGMLTREAATLGSTHDRVSATPSEADYGVALLAHDGRTHTYAQVHLPHPDAEQFALNVLSIVAHQREQERREAEGE